MPVETFGIENTEAEEYKNNRSDDNSTVKDMKKGTFLFLSHCKAYRAK